MVSAAGHAVSLLIGVVTLGVLMRYLAPAGYGQFTQATVFLNLVMQIAAFGLPLAQLHLMARGDLDETRVVNGILGLRLLIGIASMVLGPVLFTAIYEDPATRQLVWIGCVAFFFSYLGNSLRAVFQRHLVMMRSAAAGVLNRGVFLLLVLVCVVAELPTWCVMVALVATQFLTLLLMLRLVRSLVRARPRYDATVWKEAVRTSWPVALLTLLGSLCMQGDILVLGKYRPEYEVGLYAVSFRVLLQLVGAVPAQFMPLLLPQLTQAWHRGDRGAFAEHLHGAFDFITMMLVPLAVAIGARADEIVAILDPEYAAAAGILRIHILAVVAMFFGVLYRQLGVTVERQRHLIVPTIVVTSLTMAGFLWLIPIYGVNGAAWVKVFHATAGAIVTWVVVFPAVRHVPRLMIMAKALLAGGAMWGVLHFLPSLPFCLELLVGLGAYVGALFATRALTPRGVRETIAALRARGPAPASAEPGTEL